jgi:hypothetical protein
MSFIIGRIIGKFYSCLLWVSSASLGGCRDGYDLLLQNPYPLRFIFTFPGYFTLCLCGWDNVIERTEVTSEGRCQHEWDRTQCVETNLVMQHVVTLLTNELSLICSCFGSYTCLVYMNTAFVLQHFSQIMFLTSAQWCSAGLRARWSGVRVWAGAGNFSLHHRVQTVYEAHAASYPTGTKGSFPGGKAAGAWSWPLTYI